jgi:SAM-dependent MidA family methyltransferase
MNDLNGLDTGASLTTSSGLPASGLSVELVRQIAGVVRQNDGWIGFDRFMAEALYRPGLGYYANHLPKFGATPDTDFVTAPEMTPLFGYALAQQVAQALQMTNTFEIWEFGAGSGALAQHLLDSLAAMGQRVDRYTIVDLSESLIERQRQRLRRFGNQIGWASALPTSLQGVVVGNEVLDAMPVKLLARVGGNWFERGVVVNDLSVQTLETDPTAAQVFAWADRPTTLRPPLDIAGDHDYLTEIHAQGEAFVRTLAAHLQQGAVFLLDYGFPEAEYYHPQRHMGTVMCHRAQKADGDPLADVGCKDITAHVNFTGIALAAQEAGLDVLGYTSQAHFLLNCGLADAMQNAPLPQRAMAQKLVMEHEMGELFKVIGLVKGASFEAMGFVRGDRSHRL